MAYPRPIGGPCDSNAWIPDAVERIIDDLAALGFDQGIARYINRSVFPSALQGCFVYGMAVPATYLVQTIHSRSGGVGVSDDVEVTTTHWRWDGAGDPDGSDFETVMDRMDGFWTAIAGLRHPSIRVSAYRWYPAVTGGGGPGPAIYVKDVNIPGTGSGNLLPPQISTTLTQITDVRRRWGRFYIGGLIADYNTANGRFDGGAMTVIADEAQEAFLNTALNWRLQVFGDPSPNSLPVREIRVDDVWDVIRSRRYDVTLLRETRSLDP